MLLVDVEVQVSWPSCAGLATNSEVSVVRAPTPELAACWVCPAGGTIVRVVPVVAIDATVSTSTFDPTICSSGSVTDGPYCVTPMSSISGGCASGLTRSAFMTRVNMPVSAAPDAVPKV